VMPTRPTRPTTADHGQCRPIRSHPKKKPDAEFTTRMLLSLVNDAVALESYAARVRAQVAALAKEYGIKMPVAKDVE
jgi:hypothetical protein